MRGPAPFCRVVGGFVALAAALFGAGVLAAPPASAATPRTVRVVVAMPSGPPAPVRFTLEGMAEQTDATGTAVVPVSDLNTAAATLQVPDQQLSSSVRIHQYKIVPESNHGDFSRSLVVEVEISSPVTLDLVDPSHKPVPLQRVQSVTLSDSLGGEVHLTRAQLMSPTVWLTASVPVQSPNGNISNRPVAYSVKSVLIHGANVVNAGQIRATVSRSTTWHVPVILRSLTIVGNNFLTGAGAGRSVRLTYPDGYERTIPLGHDHRVTVAGLPRGTYEVKLIGGGWPIASSVRLSRNQAVSEIMVTYGNMLEMLAIVAVIVAAVTVAAVIGRRRRRELYGSQPGGHGVAVT